MSIASKKKVVFLVDDEPGVLKALSKSLEELEHIRTECFLNAEECLSKLEKDDCSVIVSDVNLPQMDGIQLAERAGKIRPELPVLLITAYGEIPTAVRGIKAGAKDFIEKPLNEQTFLNAVRQALSSRSNEYDPDYKALTKTEKIVLKEIAEGLTNKQIANKLKRSERTIENHRYNIIRKLDCNTAADLVKSAIKMGLVDC